MQVVPLLAAPRDKARAPLQLIAGQGRAGGLLRRGEQLLCTLGGEARNERRDAVLTDAEEPAPAPDPLDVRLRGGAERVGEGWRDGGRVGGGVAMGRRWEGVGGWEQEGWL